MERRLYCAQSISIQTWSRHDLERLRANLSWKPAHCYRAMQSGRAPEPARSTHVLAHVAMATAHFLATNTKQSGLRGDGNAATTKSSEYLSGYDGGSGDAGKTEIAQKSCGDHWSWIRHKHFKNETPAVSSHRGRKDVGKSLSTGRYAGMTPFCTFRACCDAD